MTRPHVGAMFGRASNFAVERTAGSHPLAASAQRERYAEMECVTVGTNVGPCLRSGGCLGIVITILHS